MAKKILAISAEGAEFFYRASTAHDAPQSRIEKVRAVLNYHRYNLNPGEVWAVHEVDAYSNAYYPARRFKYCKDGSVIECYNRG